MMQQKVALIADDDEFFRMALQAILTKRLGFSSVVEAGSLDEAIELLSEREGISIALFDLAMPGMQSAANLRAVRENFPSLRVAVVSGSERRMDILAALQAGVHGYVPKGLGIRELPGALQMIIDGSIYVPPCIAEVPANSDEAVTGTLGNSSRGSVPGADLTPRQRQVLELLVQGKSNKEIARALKLGDGTVKIHIAALFRNLGVNSRSAASAAGARLLVEAQRR
jgi:DNA-binding NarL/FixJ family response regulator